MRTLFIFLLSTCSIYLNAQPICKSIYDSLNGPNHGVSSIIQNSDSSYTVFTSDYGLIAMRLDNSGNILWSKTTMATGIFVDGFMQADTTTDSGYIATGSCYLTTLIHDVYLTKLDRAGQTMWVRSIGSALFNEGGRSVKYTKDAGFIIAGEKHFGTTTVSTQGGYLVKTDSAGNLIWAKGFHALYAFATDVIETEDAFFSVGAAGIYFGAPRTAFLLKTDKSGNTLWTKGYLPSDASFSCLIRDGNDLLLAGYHREQGGGYGYDASLMKVDTFGNPVWNKQYHFDGITYASKVIKTIDRGYLVFATLDKHNPPSDSSRVVFIKTDSLGNMQWCKIYGDKYNQCEAYKILQKPNGDFTSVSMYYTSTVQMLLLRTDSLGNCSGACEVSDNPLVLSPAVNDTNIFFTEQFYNDSSISFPFFTSGNYMIAVDSCSIGWLGIASIPPFSINLFPNPSTGLVTIVSPISNYEIEVFNAFGYKMYTQNANTNKLVIDMTSFPKGWYTCLVKTQGKVGWTRNFVLE